MTFAHLLQSQVYSTMTTALDLPTCIHTGTEKDSSRQLQTDHSSFQTDLHVQDDVDPFQIVLIL